MFNLLVNLFNIQKAFYFLSDNIAGFRFLKTHSLLFQSIFDGTEHALTHRWTPRNLAIPRGWFAAGSKGSSLNSLYCWKLRWGSDGKKNLAPQGHCEWNTLGTLTPQILHRSRSAPHQLSRRLCQVRGRTKARKPPARAWFASLTILSAYILSREWTGRGSQWKRTPQ